jgi:hypothetical protein
VSAITRRQVPAARGRAARRRLRPFRARRSGRRRAPRGEAADEQDEGDLQPGEDEPGLRRERLVLAIGSARRSLPPSPHLPWNDRGPRARSATGAYPTGRRRRRVAGASTWQISSPSCVGAPGRGTGTNGSGGHDGTVASACTSARVSSSLVGRRAPRRTTGASRLSRWGAPRMVTCSGSPSSSS